MNRSLQVPRPLLGELPPQLQPVQLAWVAPLQAWRPPAPGGWTLPPPWPMPTSTPSPKTTVSPTTSYQMTHITQLGTHLCRCMMGLLWTANFPIFRKPHRKSLADRKVCSLLQRPPTCLDGEKPQSDYVVQCILRVHFLPGVRTASLGWQHRFALNQSQ